MRGTTPSSGCSARYRVCPRLGAALPRRATTPATSTTTPPRDGGRRAASGGCSSGPGSYARGADGYEPISWQDAFALVGNTLRGLESPDQASFYTSGRLSNEATFLYQLWVREYGTNNLPDCSNMCHEASGRALTAAIGSGKGTVDLTDWEAADAIWLMADNAATNAPRMLTWLAEADRRGAQLVPINPPIEAACSRPN